MAIENDKNDIQQLMDALVEPSKEKSYDENFSKLIDHVRKDPSQFTLRRKLSDGESEDKFQLESGHIDELIWRFENRDQARLVCPDCPPRKGCIRLPWYEWGRCVYMCWPPQF